MAGKVLDMSKLRRVLKLYCQGSSKSHISASLGLSRNTVKKYIKEFIRLKLTYEELDQQDDLQLESLFIGSDDKELSDRLQNLYSYFPYVEKQLRKTGVTRLLLWEEYKLKQPDGVQSSQFCEHYNRWSKSKNVDPVMHIEHKAGEEMFIDYAGDTLQLVDPQSGEICELQFFVAVLGASQLTYAEASYSQQKEDFIQSVENALHYFGGVPKVIVPDNLKSAVTKSHRYEPKINETFSDFAEHYGTSILPARSRKPRDKALVELAVKILYTRIYTFIQGQPFFELTAINKVVWERLDKHNTIKLTGKPYSRRQLFEELESQELQPLPQDRYEIKHQSTVTVMNNGHVYLSEDKHYYSVPYQYIRKKVKLIYNSQMVEIYLKYNRIAVHKRLKSPYNYTTEKDHLASSHRFMTEWTAERFISWGTSIDESVKELIVHIFNKKQHPEQGYRSCMGILSLKKKVGKDRLIKACKKALDFEVYNYMIVQTILDREWDKHDDIPEEKETTPNHLNIRGKNYYK